jgi:hypothetical protein
MWEMDADVPLELFKARFKEQHPRAEDQMMVSVVIKHNKEE